jgi:16S rRNA (guanine1516-N2)-methyltransferase
MIIGNNTLSIGVYPEAHSQHQLAESLAAELKIPLAIDNIEEFKLLLICTEAGLTIKQTDKKSPGPISVSFTDATTDYRLKHGGGRNQNLARAIGLKRNWHPRLIDATAGLGRDGFILAHLGCQVQMLERSPILAAMLTDGLQRAKLAEGTRETAGRIKLVQDDSRDFLKKLKNEEKPDVIYLDPMYPERTKSSLVKKEMRILREVAGDDPDADELFETALEQCTNRVVVKRPRLAPALGTRPVSHSIKGKTSRFDVYLV